MVAWKETMFDPDYEVFLAIVEAGSVSAAARAGGASTASYSKRLARLEARLGVKLLHRTTRRLELTSNGHMVFHEIEAIRTALGAIEDRVGGRGDIPSGPLRLTVPTSFGRLHLAPVLAEFGDRYPQVALEIELSDAYVDLRASRFDLAIRIAARVESGLRSVRLAPNRRVLCAAPGYRAARGMPGSLAELGEHCLLAADGQLPWLLEGPNGAVVFEGEAAILTNSSDFVRELALAGRGIALRSLWDVAPHLRSGELVRVLPEWEGSRDAGIHVVYAPTVKPRPATEALVELLRERFASAGESWVF